MPNPSHVALTGNSNYVLIKDKDTVTVSATAATDVVEIGGATAVVGGISVGDVIGGYTVSALDTSSGYKVKASKITYLVPRTALSALDLCVGSGIEVTGDTISFSADGVLYRQVT